MYLFIEFVSVLYFVTAYDIKPIARTLYWLLHCLSVKQCVNYKMASLMFKVLSSLTPAYLSDLIQGAVSVWPLWSYDALSDKHRLKSLSWYSRSWLWTPESYSSLVLDFVTLYTLLNDVSKPIFFRQY